jgi:hypothetical protein
MSDAMRSHADADAVLERIKKLERLLAEAPADSLRHRELTQAIRIEATAYRKSLDDDQAAKTVTAPRARNRTP